ncbi:HAMP domain-containing histidine kinase [Pseudonocardia sp. DSM 110487]|uniref:sensor histidine kinase n=1 Tax=Pseudonocardia sp. DSM 110487 TaxID=2865833 RepID=UPI001C6A4518|nr:HAMP domain-containing sensor histidine kinase [Pseudonocardia sp. DSM 110487]QYN34493.1 HAMP domain-containing histidine kinase [Pseudonocardia sp. DSM 110487]
MRLPVAVAPWDAPGQSAAACRVIRDVVLVITAIAVVAVVCPPLQSQLPHARLTLVLALFVAAGGASAALLATLVARLTATPRIGWLSLVLACYSLLAIPTTMIGALDVAPALAVGAVRLLVHGIIVVFLIVALIGSPPPVGWRTGHTVLGGCALIAAAGGIGLTFPTAVQAVMTSPQARIAGALVWSGLAAAIALRAVRRRAWPLWQVGAGLTLLGITDAGRACADIWLRADLDLVFSGVDLLAVGVVLWGTVHLAGDALDRLADEQAAHDEELRLAEIRLARTAERDHELRNGLAGLAGATSLMRADRADPLLRDAVASELCRLDELLRGHGDGRSLPGSSTYAIGPVLNGLVALHAANGMDIRLDSDPGLRANGAPDALAQVMANLVGNVARHAPGSPVRLTAFRDGDGIVIHVRDFGPGIPPGREHAVFEPGVRAERTGGTGLGLHICRKLVEASCGSIEIAPPTPDRVGCTVVVRLPGPPASDEASQSPIPARLWCNAS